MKHAFAFGIFITVILITLMSLAAAVSLAQSAAPLPTGLQWQTPAYSAPIAAPAAHVSQNSPQDIPQNVPQISANETTATHSRRLQFIAVAEFEHRLLERLGNRFVPVKQTISESGAARYRLPVRGGTFVDLQMDRATQTVFVTGNAASTAAIGKLIEMLDVAPQPNTRTEIISLPRELYRTMAQTADVIESETRDASNPRDTNSPRGNNPNAIAERTPRNNNAEQNVAAAIKRASSDGLIGPVKIEMLDGLETIVVTGKKNDVQIVMDMVRQIESLQLDTEPEITIYRLQETDCTRIAQIVVRLYNEVYLSRRGSVTFLALVKPNAILMVGHKNSVQTAIDLIRKLDVPVPPDSEFVVVRLQYAASATVKTQIDEFYTDRGVLSPLVRVTSDVRTNSLILQGSPRDLTEATAFIRSLDVPRGVATNQMRVIPLKNSLASELATTITNAISSTSGTGNNNNAARNAVLEMTALDPKSGALLQSGVLNDVRVTADTRSNSLLVSAPAETLPLVEALILQLDRLPAAESQVKLFTIVNGDASSLVTMLQTIFQSTSGTGTTGNTNSFATTRAGTASDDSTLVSTRFAVDTRTNTILATGSASDMSLVEAILLRLDEDNIQNREVIVFRLLNSPAADIATALNTYITGERQLELQSSGTFYPQSPLEQYRKEVVVVAEPISNNLIVSTTPRFAEQIKRIVATLDERPPKVIIQVFLAQVSLTNGRDFGVELGLQDSILFDRSLAGIPGFNFINGALGNNTTNPNSDWVGTQGVTNLGVGRTNSSGSGGFVFSASSESLAILIRALEEQRKVQVLARPQLAIVDNKRATISSGETARMVTSVSQTNTGTVSGTEETEAGMILDVTPRITPDGMVIMDIYAERSRFGPEAEGTVVGIQGTREIRVPRKEMVKVQTTISAMNGQTVILGGLITEDKSTVTRGVPVLNKIPVIKSLFEYKSTSCTRSELIIIMTPMIINSECEMELIKQQELARIHVCVSDVIRLGGDEAWRARSGDWSGSETEVIWMSQPTKPAEKDLPSMEKVKTKVAMPKTE